MNHAELDRLVKYVKQEASPSSSHVHVQFSKKTKKGKEIHIEQTPNPKNFEPQNPFEKPHPFYVSLFIVRYKLSNYLIDSRAFDNVMLAQVAKALGLSLTSSHGKCYLMDST